MRSKRAVYLYLVTAGVALMWVGNVQSQATTDLPLVTRYKDFQLYGGALNTPSVNAPTDPSNLGSSGVVPLAAPVPEPATLALLLGGLAGVAGLALSRRRRT